MSPLALKIIREEHAALSAMLRSLALMIERGPESSRIVLTAPAPIGVGPA